MASETDFELSQRLQNLAAFRFHPDSRLNTAFDFVRVPGVDGVMFGLRLGGGNWCVVEFETVSLVAATKGIPGKRLPALYVLRSPDLTGSDAQRAWDRMMVAIKAVDARWGGSSSTLIRSLGENEDGIRVRGVSDFLVSSKRLVLTYMLVKKCILDDQPAFDPYHHRFATASQHGRTLGPSTTPRVSCSLLDLYP